MNPSSHAACFKQERKAKDVGFTTEKVRNNYIFAGDCCIFGPEKPFLELAGKERLTSRNPDFVFFLTHMTSRNHECQGTHSIEAFL